MQVVGVCVMFRVQDLRCRGWVWGFGSGVWGGGFDSGLRGKQVAEGGIGGMQEGKRGGQKNGLEVGGQGVGGEGSVKGKRG